MLLPALEAVDDFPFEGVALPVLSEEAVSEPTAFEEAVPLSPAEVPADAAFPPEPPSTRQQSLDDTLGRSDTEVIMCAPLLFARLVVCGQTNFAFCTSYLRVLACASIGPVTWPCFLRSVSGILLLPVTKALHALEWGSGRMHSLFHVSFIRRSHLLLLAFSWGDSGRGSLLWPLRLRVRAYCN